jgi:hypothetical protein
MPCRHTSSTVGGAPVVEYLSCRPSAGARGMGATSGSGMGSISGALEMHPAIAKKNNAVPRRAMRRNEPLSKHRRQSNGDISHLSNGSASKPIPTYRTTLSRMSGQNPSCNPATPNATARYPSCALPFDTNPYQVRWPSLLFRRTDELQPGRPFLDFALFAS